jgi:hypothetical protein
MPADRTDSAGDDPDIPFDYEDEDEIMTELRQIRRQIMAEFNNDLTAYVTYLGSRQDELRSRGFRYSTIPRLEPIKYNPDGS